MIYTSYFGNLKRIENPLAITARPPVWFKGPNYHKLAPNELLLWDHKNKKINDYEYITLFTKLLDLLSPREIYNELIETYGENVTLLCFEKPPQFCHRHIVAIWLQDNLGITVSELPY